ncbi:phage regulatory CII family protein [Oleidesulfovibrio sp.]|uniref:phage regulatory CII family protein n=1 Tax=Oleidesulfovibrio sp. TaxID=2909707 RepID=UPI003A8779E5
MVYPSITAVMHQNVKRAASGLPAKQIAHLLGREYHTLMSELSGQPNHKLGADTLLPLMQLTGSDEVLHVMARWSGGIYINVPPHAGATELGKAVLQSVKEFGEYAAESAAYIQDGKLPSYELNKILKEGQEAVTAIAAFMELAKRVHHEQFGGTPHATT